MENAIVMSEVLATSLTTVSNDVLGGIAVILPIALTVFGALTVIRVGRNVFKSFSKQ